MWSARARSCRTRGRRRTCPRQGSTCGAEGGERQVSADRLVRRGGEQDSAGLEGATEHIGALHLALPARRRGEAHFLGLHTVHTPLEHVLQPTPACAHVGAAAPGQGQWLGRGARVGGAVCVIEGPSHASVSPTHGWAAATPPKQPLRQCHPVFVVRCNARATQTPPTRLKPGLHNWHVVAEPETHDAQLAALQAATSERCTEGQVRVSVGAKQGVVWGPPLSMSARPLTQDTLAAGLRVVLAAGLAGGRGARGARGAVGNSARCDEGGAEKGARVSGWESRGFGQAPVAPASAIACPRTQDTLAAGLRVALAAGLAGGRAARGARGAVGDRATPYGGWTGRAAGRGARGALLRRLPRGCTITRMGLLGCHSRQHTHGTECACTHARGPSDWQAAHPRPSG